ncbi:MAG: NAD+ synthase, partial [Thermodesulfobacteriota bacterium]|nr:NAD+ synthase [Thermodesulfobacteriota bacterium]
MNPTIGDFEHNTEKMMGFIEKAKGLSCDLIVFSELVISGYPPRDFLERQEFVQENLSQLRRLVDSVTGIGVICGFVDENPDDEGNSLFNSAVLFDTGKILHQTHKRLLPDYDIFDERRYFEPGKEWSPFSYKGSTIGLTICEDIWNDSDFLPKRLFPRRLYPIDPVAGMIKQGADLIINMSASPFYAGKKALRRDMLGNMAKKYRIPFFYVNQVGGNDSVVFDGESMVFDAKGQIAARALDFEEDMVLFDTSTQKGDLHPVSDTEVESVLKALMMGTRDYVQKCGFSEAVIGLSGGIDSALTACIAVEALGKEKVKGVFMPSPYTSQASDEDTTELARNLGIELFRIPISGIFKGFLQALPSAFHDAATDITGQNIQARIRGVLLMAFCNKLGALLLATGNKSELAVGYCTLYGDMSGGLAVISDVPKAMVYELAHFINRDQEIIPERILQKPPSAELKPGQVDQDDLPPYDLLDGISKAYIEENRGADDIVAMGFAPAVVKETIRRINRSEYKRHQAPPGLKVTSKSFGYGRRYPIAQKFSP